MFRIESNAGEEIRNIGANVQTEAVDNLATWLDEAARSVGVLVDDTPKNSQKDNLQIEADAPVAEVVKVVLDSFGDGRVATKSVDLGPPGDAGLDVMTGVVLFELGGELVDIERPFGARADDAHVAFEDVKELWNFIEAGVTQESADSCTARVVANGPTRPGLFARCHPHRAELIHLECFSVHADTVLLEEDWTG